MDKDKYWDLRRMPQYTPTYEKGNFVEVYGYKVQLPDEPDDKYCINYGKKKAEQTVNWFDGSKHAHTKKVYIPEDLAYQEQPDMERFIAAEWHRRKNGVWILINGKKYYITGPFYFFLFYWYIETGGVQAFRMSDLDFFIIWMHVVRTVTIFGLLDMKCRRIGDTEKALCIIYEYAGRVKNTNNVMQDCRTEKDIEETYDRLAKAHKKIVWFMKPVDSGSYELDFNYPRDVQSRNKVKDRRENNMDSIGDVDFEFDAIGSKINWYASVASASDGKRHGRALVDEWGKAKQMQLKDAWRYMKQSLIDQITEEICGKCIAPSTVEEVKGGAGIDIVMEEWDNADPDKVSDTGETVSGFIRIFRGALERGRPDKYGYTDKEALRTKIISHIKLLTQQKKFNELVSYRRQNCITIEDVFTSIAEDSGFNTENLAQRSYRLKYDITPKKWTRGNYEWLDGKRESGVVVWMPCENGRWVSAGTPEKYGFKANAQNEYANIHKPGNAHAFCGGVDPYAQADVLEKHPSKGGIAIKFKLNKEVDTADMYDDNGDPLYGGENFKTNRYVCAYKFRHPDPADFYEDVIKTMVFWGCQFIAEKQFSSALLTHMQHRGYFDYHMSRTNPNIKNYLGQVEKGGVSANTKTIESYFSYLTTLSHKWCNAIDIPDICDELLSTNMDNRGKRDLAVAVGFCEIAANVDTKAPKDRTAEEDNRVFEEQYV